MNWYGIWALKKLGLANQILVTDSRNHADPAFGGRSPLRPFRARSRHPRFGFRVIVGISCFLRLPPSCTFASRRLRRPSSASSYHWERAFDFKPFEVALYTHCATSPHSEVQSSAATMRVRSRRKAIAFFVALGVCLVALAVTLNVSWIILNWRAGVLLLFGVIFFAAIIAGMILNTGFLVREIRRNEQHDSFINAVTHELKTPIASIRLYLETLQRREVDEAAAPAVLPADAQRCGSLAGNCRAGSKGRPGGLQAPRQFPNGN